MPIIDGGIDIPALEWCSILEAVLWIECRQIPVDPAFEAAIPDRISRVGLDEQGRSLGDPMTFQNSLGKLFALACAGGVSLHGRPALGKIKKTINHIGTFIASDKWGGDVHIPSEKIKEAGIAAFSEAAKFGFLSDGFCYSDTLLPKSAWAYSNTCVSFLELADRHPPAQGQSIRIGENATLTDQANQGSNNEIGSKIEIDAGSVSIKNAGGRPRVYDWEGAILAVLYDIFVSGILNEDDRPSWKRSMKDWFASQDQHPSDSEVKKRVRRIADKLNGGE